MTPEVAVRARLLQLVPLAALVSARIYLHKFPQSPTWPAVRVLLVDEIRRPHLRGGSKLGRTRVQVDAYAQEASGADPYAQATAVAAAAHGDEAGSGLQGWVGDLGAPPAIRITGLMRADRAAGYDPDELRLVRIRQDYLVHFTDL